MILPADEVLRNDNEALFNSPSLVPVTYYCSFSLLGFLRDGWLLSDMNNQHAHTHTHTHTVPHTVYRTSRLFTAHITHIMYARTHTGEHSLSRGLMYKTLHRFDTAVPGEYVRDRSTTSSKHIGCYKTRALVDLCTCKQVE